MQDRYKRSMISDYVAGLKAVIDAVPVDAIETLIDLLEDAYESDRQLFVIGNGGSAATASHLACDLSKTVLGRSGPLPTKRFRVISLTDNHALVTAWGNDFGFDIVFAEQLRNLARAGDVLLVITGSGNSPNILAAVGAARELGLTSVGLLGFDGGAVRSLLDHAVIAESDHYGYIEDVHMMLTHLVTAYLKQRLSRPLAQAAASGAP